MFGTSGVRGRVGEIDHGRPRARHWTCIGDRRRRHRRPRTGRSREGRTLSRALSAGVTECGGDVIDVGVQPTPTVARERRPGRDDGVVVTALTHTPRPTTGSSSGRRRRAGIRRRRKRQNRRDRRGSGVQPRRVGRTRRAPPRRRRTRAPRASARPESVAIPRTTSRLSSTSATAWDESPPTRSTTGCDVETLNAQRDGRFPGRPSEPTAENCQTACVVVEATDATSDRSRRRRRSDDGDRRARPVRLRRRAARALGSTRSPTRAIAWRSRWTRASSSRTRSPRSVRT